MLNDFDWKKNMTLAKKTNVIYDWNYKPQKHRVRSRAEKGLTTLLVLPHKGFFYN